MSIGIVCSIPIDTYWYHMVMLDRAICITIAANYTIFIEGGNKKADSVVQTEPAKRDQRRPFEST